MIPLRDENPTLSTPVVTYAIVAANAAAWILLQGMGTDPALSRSVCELGAIPAELLGRASAGTRIPLSETAVCVLDGSRNLKSVFTSMFLHGGWFHLIGNMWFLWIFGDNVEDAMGKLRFALFYLCCGFAAVAAQVFSSPDSAVPMVGASGAIGGVMGAYAILYPRAPVQILVILGFFIDRWVVPAFMMLGFWFFLQVLGGLPALGGGGRGGGVAFWAHIGGFAAGVVLVFVFQDRRRVAAHRAAMRRLTSFWSRRRF